MDIKSASFLKGFTKEQDGVVAVIVALMLTVLFGFVAIGVDGASLYRERSELQSISDLTAVSAVAAPQDAIRLAENAIARNRAADTSIRTLETGRYLRNPAIAREDRFTALDSDDAKVNAVRVVLETDAPLYFATIFTDDQTIALDRPALASRTGAMSFRLNSNIARLGGLALNGTLTDLFGSGATIPTGDMDALENANVTMGDLISSLRSVTGNTDVNPAEILNGTTTIGDLITALQANLSPALSGSLANLANATNGTSIDVAAVVGGIDAELGLTATDFLADIDISALDVIRAAVAAEISNGTVFLDAPIGVSGVTDVNVGLVLGEPPLDSGWIALGETGTTLNRAAARLETEITIEPTLLGNLGLIGVDVASVHVPLYLEVAGATATLEEMSCNRTVPTATAARFSTRATDLHPANGTAVAALYLGNLTAGHSGPIDPGDPNDPNDLGDLDYADLVDVNLEISLLGIPLRLAALTIQARSFAAVGTSQTETVIFTQNDITTGNTTKQFGSGDLLGSAVNGLLNPANTQLRVKPEQAGLVPVLLAPLLGLVFDALPTQLLATLVGPIDGVLDGLLSDLDLGLGEGELSVTGHHCEFIKLVR